MKNKLQYLYTIAVFIGALVTSYMMMSRDEGALMAGRSVQAPNLKSEALALDPAVNQLFEMEDAISKFGKTRPEPGKRAPSDIRKQSSAADQ